VGPVVATCVHGSAIESTHTANIAKEMAQVIVKVNRSRFLFQLQMLAILTLPSTICTTRKPSGA
jgi:hypothetical protein